MFRRNPTNRHFYKKQFPSQTHPSIFQNWRPYTISMQIQGQPEEAKGVDVTYTNDPVEAEAWLRNNVVDIDTRALGFDMEWKPQFIKKKHGGKENRTAVLQLSTETATLVLHIIHMPTPPRYLVDILVNEFIVKVGSSIGPDVNKLLRDIGLPCKGVLELVDLASRAGYTKEHGRGLRTLSRNVLEIQISKPRHISMSNWENLPLTHSQIHYAAIDAWIGIMLYSHMQKKILENRAKCEVDSLIDVQSRELTVLYCNVCGKKCKGESKLQEHLANVQHPKCPNCGMMFVFAISKIHSKNCRGPMGHLPQNIVPVQAKTML